MRRSRITTPILAFGVLLGATCGRGEDTAGAVADALEQMSPVMVSLADRESPSDEEWQALHEDTQRACLFGSLGDLKSQTISFMDTDYFTPNCAEGTLASFGKDLVQDNFAVYLKEGMLGVWGST